MSATPEFHPLTGEIGAEVGNIDLTAPLTADNRDALRQGLWRYLVLIFRGQFLDRAQQKRLTQVFGPLCRLPYVVGMEDDPDVIAVKKSAAEVNISVFGGDWHSDFSFLEHPPAGSVLNAVEVPEVGGDTLWANQIAAYETLPAELKAAVEGRAAIHTGAPYGIAHAPPADLAVSASIEITRGDAAADQETRHPAVRSHPESGRKALFVNPIYTTRLEGLSEEQSREILAALYRHATRPEFCCRQRWRNGDVALWDNRATLHYAINDYDGHDRLLYRTAFAGERPT